MKKKYDFKIIEKDRYKNWINKKYFKDNLKNNITNIKKPFTIVLPPPNVTGQLHLGHAWNNVLQDVIIRRKKMLGFEVLFLPGMDHAGIATQNKVKKRLKFEGLLNNELSKEKFLKYAWEWKKEYASKIRNQWECLGLHLDYDNEKFTLDQDLSSTVRYVFIKLYKQNLIYRSDRIINWDPKTQTALSNVEVYYQKKNSYIYYLKYFLYNDNNFFLEVATTRPETIFVDQALMVHPDDKRYKHFIGSKFLIPDTNIVIPLISDSYVKPEFGSGVVKVTPAHDENDFLIGKKYNLKSVLCMNKDGTMNKMAFDYEKLDRFVCRQKLIDVLQEKSFVSKIEPYVCSIGYSSISNVPIEQRLSLQWFLKTNELAKNVLNENKINFYPLRYKKTFIRWLENLQDWCISRQLWWGHSIPAWHKGSEIKVQIESPGKEWKADPDVLDTWFSSSLWPFSVLGWPNKDNFNFKYRFPVDVLVTGYDILTFWVSRMCLQSLHLTQKDPFKDVLLHGLIRDAKGNKMSKSKGNGIDPILIIEKYGTDALRWFLTTNSSPGMDLNYNESKIYASWNFLNKIWNISRFFKLKFNIFTEDFDENKLLFPEKAVLTQFMQLLTKVDILFEKYEFHEVGKLIYKFIWEDFANWGLEFLKDHIQKSNTQKFLIYIFNNILKLLNPFIPFLTDFIYIEINKKDTIMLSSWPKINYENLECLKDFEILKNLIIKMRKFVKKYEINSFRLISIELELSIEKQKILLPFKSTLKKFFHVNDIILIKKVNKKNKTLLFVEKYISVYLDKNIFLFLNKQKNKSNLQIQKEFIFKEIKRSENILNNKDFLTKANPNKIIEEKNKYRNYLSEYKKIMNFLSHEEE
ncbi:valine--tRNA ligase [Candidatus Phytoplasma prunorum]|uniref:valine--tRNA ligase n=1 Tax=Candidatus Phytoplasma prunorum TaxID=47565 RepID=UPI002FEF6D45